ncbi:hypothetical protein BKA66DRAFT_417787 [Pyrenochaeta sp. MPI-SDFR-AT-0127]|nr:hypothetical protein BKA66DRAFT_417787 [Pyrenochaeta sp. MPI-SDFR-AT-0127]
MAKGPAVVVVARHGARLDAADKTWHLTSPTPYDPPLTYGGWSQGKALGLRIAALLHQRDNEQADAAKNGPNSDLAHLEFSKLDAERTGKPQADGPQRPKKKRKIIIHSSPYLRCVQTSTAVAAGISQYQSPTTPHLTVPTPSKERNGLLTKSPLAKSPRSKSTLSRPIALQPLADPTLEVFPKPHIGPDKVLLRIDAFLGEWLSPDYFEDITPPPNSTMMVAGAKADLLRRGDYIQELPNTLTSKGHFPGGWVKGGKPDSRPSTETGAFPNLSSLAQVSPFRERSSSHGSSSSLQRTRSREAIASMVPSTQHIPSRLYEAPIPSYSVSPADPIPRGYFAHAREACVTVDFQWDSMRAPQDWGDGGEYGDEWSTMHKRFRRGLAGMMQWYRENGSAPPKDQFPGFMFKVLSNRPSPPISKKVADPFPTFDDENDGEDDEELVLILLTHGAGCNALLGAISNQPVLIDVGLASLSMAVRRAEPRKPSMSTIYDRRLSVADPGMADTYEMKLLASTDHLRPGVDPAKLQSQSKVNSPAVMPSPSLEYRRKFSGSPATNSPVDSPFSIGEPYRSWNSSLGSVRRTMSSGSNSRFMQQRPNTSGAASPSTGLWSGSRTPTIDGSSDGRPSPGAEMVFNFGNQVTKPKATVPTSNPHSSTIPALDGTSEAIDPLTKLDSKEESETGDRATPLVKPHGRTSSAVSSPGLWGVKAQPKAGNGLWGPPKLDDVYEHGRGPKRRWTVTEREDSH